MLACSRLLLTRLISFRNDAYNWLRSSTALRRARANLSFSAADYASFLLLSATNSDCLLLISSFYARIEEIVCSYVVILVRTSVSMRWLAL